MWKRQTIAWRRLLLLLLQEGLVREVTERNLKKPRDIDDTGTGTAIGIVRDADAVAGAVADQGWRAIATAAAQVEQVGARGSRSQAGVRNRQSKHSKTGRRRKLMSRMSRMMRMMRSRRSRMNLGS